MYYNHYSPEFSKNQQTRNKLSTEATHFYLSFLRHISDETSSVKSRCFFTQEVVLPRSSVIKYNVPGFIKKKSYKLYKN